MVSCRNLVAFVSLILVTQAAAPAAKAQSTIYVDDDAALGGNGQTWNTAYKYLQDALAAAYADDEIRIAGGIYRPDHDEGGSVTPGSRTATFSLVQGVAMYGGYRGLAGGGDPNDRDVSAYETILSGDLLDNDVVPFGNYGENSFHVVTAGATITPAGILDGLTIEHGNANGPSLTKRDRGGGMFNAGSPTVVNCTIRDSMSSDIGGGAHLESGSPSFAGCTFSGNASSWGGGLYASADNANCSDCTFTGNTVSHSGGGMYAEHDITLLSCLIENNDARWGGGVYAEGQGTSITFQGCMIRSNQADYDAAIGGGYAGGVEIMDGATVTFENACVVENNTALDGGGILIAATGTTGTIRDCTIRNNNALYDPVEGWGGSGGGVYVGQGAVVTVEDDCTIEENSGVAGGGCYVWGSSLTIKDSLVRGNSVSTGWPSSGWGGGIGYWESQGEVVNCKVYDNHASRNGGGISICASTGARPTEGNVCEGGEVTVPTSQGSSPIGFADLGKGRRQGAKASSRNAITVANCTLVKNTAAWGGGVEVQAQSPVLVNCSFTANEAIGYGGALRTHGSPTNPQILNSILWDDVAPSGPELGLAPGSEATVSYSDIEGGQAAVYIGSGSTLHWGTGNLNANPLFEDADGADDTYGTEDDDLRLSFGSPCIDAGDNTVVTTPTDLDGNPRFQDDPATPDTGNGTPPLVDMGAYEYQPCPGDINGDGFRNVSDFTLFAAAYGSQLGDPNYNAAADLNGNGFVNTTDFTLFAAVFGVPCS
jgi:predicted outer membrane repeat protein